MTQRSFHPLGSGAVYAAARQLLLSGDEAGALDMFRAGDVEFRAPRAAWALWALQRKRGEAEGARAEADRIRKEYAGTVPAEFLSPQPGDEWYVPDGGYLGL